MKSTFTRQFIFSSVLFFGFMVVHFSFVNQKEVYQQNAKLEKAIIQQKMYTVKKEKLAMGETPAAKLRY